MFKPDKFNQVREKFSDTWEFWKYLHAQQGENSGHGEWCIPAAIQGQESHLIYLGSDG